jgi:hypothetical protein
LVVVRDLDFVSISRLPAKTHSILLVDPEAVFVLERMALGTDL